MKKLLSKLGAKIAAVFLIIMTLILCAASAAGTAYLVSENAYADGGKAARNQLMDDLARSEISMAADYYKLAAIAEKSGSDDYNITNFQDYFSREKCNFFFTITDRNGQELLSNYKDGDYQFKTSSDLSLTLDSIEKSETKHFPDLSSAQQYISSMNEKYGVIDANPKETYDQYGQPSGYEVTIGYIMPENLDITVNGYVRSNLEADDKFSRGLFWLGQLISLRYAQIAICVITLISSIALFIFLLCSAGHKEGVDGIHLNWLDRIPLDLYLAFLLVLAGLTLAIGGPGYYGLADLIKIGILVIIWLLLGLSLLLTFAARAKAGAWWKNTIFCQILGLLKKATVWFVRGIVHLLRSLPLFWKAGLVWAGLSFIEFLVLIAGSGDYRLAIIGWFVGKIIITPFILYAIINLKRLQKGGEEIANGNLAYTVDLSHMLFDFRRHGDNLNNIRAGVQKAVDERLKSERLKTELITNVSHDIKTPLTSIVNYVDLLKKENISSETVRGYVDVLDRQSARLKKMTEDLVEASKASTGNIPVCLEPTDVNVLLSQTAGEYEDKFKEQDLEIVLSTAEQPATVLADGKLLWRVFDNLMSNIRKYALAGTRVYLTSEVKGSQVLITFKNISRHALNITSGELMERFVRGDAARTTEGSGLGLSIAKSLIDLQKGKFDILIDGDLFKAVMAFEL